MTRRSVFESFPGGESPRFASEPYLPRRRVRGQRRREMFRRDTQYIVDLDGR